MQSAEGRQTDVIHEANHAAAYMYAISSGDCSRVLDVGIGDGSPLIRGTKWAGITPKITIGVDTLKNNLDHLSDAITPVNVDGVTLPFENDCFSLVICSQVIEHVNPRLQADFLKELVRVADVGANIVVATLNDHYPYNVKGHKEHVGVFSRVAAEVFINGYCARYGETELLAVLPSERVVRAQEARSKMWFLRPIRHIIPRHISETTLTILTRGEITRDLNLRGDFRILPLREVESGALYTDYIFKISKRS